MTAMNNSNVTLITEAFGHGFMALKFARAYGLAPVAFSEKETKEEFENNVDQIYNNLVFFFPEFCQASYR
jgi:hypothetical protein